MALMTILFFIGGPDYHSPRSYKSFWNLGHILYFSLFPLLLFSVSSGKQNRPIFEPSPRIASMNTLAIPVQLIVILGLTIALGVLVELFQYGFNRSPDMGDIFRNILGACIAIGFLLPIGKSVSKAPMLIYRTTLIILVAWQCYPIVIDLIDEHQSRRDFPILSDFQTPNQIHRWSGDASVTIGNDIGRNGNRALRVSLTTQTYSGVALKYFPVDWRQYQWLQFRIYNPSADAITITCRIHDKKHTQGVQRYQDRFNTTRVLAQGWNTISISLEEVRRAPDTRQMDLSQIYGVGIFASRLPHPREIYIDDVNLR